MRYDRTTHTLDLGFKDCPACVGSPGEMPQRKTCPKCKGTRRGPRGGAGGCKACFNGLSHETTGVMLPCPRCDGHYKNFQVENRCDRVPKGLLALLIDSGEMSLEVVRRLDSGTRLEAVLGVGLWSVTDYGTAWLKEDWQVREQVLSELWDEQVQATKVTDSQPSPLPMARRIMISLHRNGYSVLAESPSTGKAVA